MAVKKPIDVEKLIEKGAKVKEDDKRNHQQFTMINLRIPTYLLKCIDMAVKQDIGITRTGWILRAIHKELKNVI